ncbi:MAG TPA: hypothetical protein VKZ60_18080 [Chloroflexota bacterium]|nr:hypothetical protein [Chloroflexota bacterium]
MQRYAIGLLFAVLAVSGVVPRGSAAQQDCDIRGTVETPPEGATLQPGVVTITGWAADLTASQGTGITAVRIALDADPEQGGVALPALYGWERPDIAALLGSDRYRPSGFAMAWDTSGLPPGQHTLYIQVRNACGWTGTTRTVTLLAASGAPAAAPTTAPRPTTPAVRTPPAAAPTRFVLPTTVPVSATDVPTPAPGGN